MDLTRHSRGFTLIELMIVVAIIAVLAAVAYPTYISQIRKSKRAEAQATLVIVSARQQQMLLDTRRYVATTALLNVSVPITVSKAYDITIAVGAATVPSFVATATPKGSQVADGCSVMSINQAGIKSPATCW